MHLQITIPEDTSPDRVARIKELFLKLEKNPAFVDEIELDSNFDEIQKKFTPEVLAHLDQVSKECDEGKCYSVDEVKQKLAETRTEWLKNNPTSLLNQNSDNILFH